MIGVLALCGAAVAGGAVAVGYGMTTPARPASTGRSTVVNKVTNGMVRVFGVGIAAGIAAFVATGWLVLLVATPALVAGVWYLLATPVNRDLRLLEALDRWVRTLAATMPTGHSVIDAVRVSRRQAPPLLAGPLDLAVRRLDERWTAREALFALADELASPDVDAVVAALVLAAERGGTGATATLHGIAESLQERLRAAREIETERAKPRVVVRQVTVITLVVLALALVVGRSFFAPFGSPTGQVVLACLLAAYLGSLLALRRLTASRRRPRILRRVT